jgi:hypothetical protein
MTVFDGALVLGSVILALLSGYSAALMLYAWEDEEKLSRNSVPDTYEPPRHRFTLLLPARHEEEVIQARSSASWISSIRPSWSRS